MFTPTKQVLQTRLRVMGLAIAAIVITSCAACGGGGGGGGGPAVATPATLTIVGSAPSTPSVPAVPLPLVVGLEASRLTGVAPLSVFFDATTTTALSTSKPFHDLRYQWNFGDPSSGTWSKGTMPGTSSKNLASGPVASHLFETPGTYTVTVQVNDSTYSTAKTVQITVQDPNVVFAANTVCFSASGNFVGCPSGGAQVITTNFADALNNYQSTKKRLLFRAGEIFTSTSKATVNAQGPGFIGKFGTGVAPKFTTIATDTFFQLSDAASPNTKDWRIVDLELDGQNGAAMGANFQGGIDQVTMLRLNIHNVKSGINNSPGGLDNYNSHPNASYHGHHLWDQFAFIDSQIVTVNGGVAVGGQIGAFISGTRHTMMGSTIDPAYGGEHAVRNPYLDRAVLSHNYMARPASTKHSWTLRGADQAVTGSLIGTGMATQKVVAAENVFFNDISSWTVTVAPTNTFIDERIQDVIVERNYFVGGSGTQIALVSRGSTKNLAVRNNVFNLTGNTSYAAAMSLSGGADIVVPPSTGHTIANNTIYRSDAAGGAVGITLGGNSSNYTIKNNLAYIPTASSRTVISGSIDSGLVTGGNSSNAQAALSPLFQTVSSSNVLAISDFKPTTGSYAINTGDYIPVLEDIYRETRTGAYDLGAVNP